MATFGVEEEYGFLDPISLEPRDDSPAVYRALGVQRIESRFVQREFLLCQLERPSPVMSTRAEAELDLNGFRRRLGAASDQVGVIAASIGAFPCTPKLGTVTAKLRYTRVIGEFRGLARQHFYNGLHVHVAIADRESGVRALNGLRSWIPVITALAANSPLWRGVDTGFASWRTLQLQRWATRGTPPQFVDASDYDRRVARVVGVGATFDSALIAWNLRLSNHVPTIEVRAPDAQLEAWQSVLLATIIRGLVATILEQDDRLPLDPELIDAALWHSARDGITGSLVHPFTGELAEARTVIDALLDYTGAALEREDDLEWVRAHLDRLCDEGTGAQRQRDAFTRGGLPALAALLRSSLAPE